MPKQKIHIRCKKCRVLNTIPVEKIKNHIKCGKCSIVLEFPRTPVNISTSTFKQEIIDWPELALLDFWAIWCGACRIIEPVLKELADKKPGQLKIAKIDIDKEPGLAQQFGITATPTLIFYKNGKKLKEIRGAPSKDQLETWINALI